MTQLNSCQRTEDAEAIRHLCTVSANLQSSGPTWAASFLPPEPALCTGLRSFEARIDGRSDYDIDFNSLAITPPTSPDGPWQYTFGLVDRHQPCRPGTARVTVQCEFVYHK